MQKNTKIWVLIGVLMVIFSIVITGCAAPTAEPTEEPAAVEPTAEEQEDMEEAEPDVSLEGDQVRGGLLYDKWWTVAEVDQPSGDQPLWATQSTNERSGGDTWRCKECVSRLGL
jgi:hypothetical protein